MNSFNLAQLFMYWGKYIKPEHMENFRSYFSKMLARNRVIAVLNGTDLECIICFFLTDEMDTFINRPTWSTPIDNEHGHIIFIDKMVARKWTPELRRTVYDQIESKFPQVDKAIWLREPFNRSVIINKRSTHVHSQIS